MTDFFRQPGFWLVIVSIISVIFCSFFELKKLSWNPLAKFVVIPALLLSASVIMQVCFPLSVYKFLAAALIIFVALVISMDFIMDAILRVKVFIVSRNPKFTSMPSYISETCAALETLAKNKVGALIIIDRKEDVLPLITQGIEFDASVNAEIIKAMFQLKSPVHDGALIISSGRIKRVKAVLPLSTNDALPMGIGTRHRAAIGVTERTGGIAVVASEERGEISVAYKGVIRKASSQDELLKFVMAALKGHDLRLLETPPAV